MKFFVIFYLLTNSNCNRVLEMHENLEEIDNYDLNRELSKVKI